MKVTRNKKVVIPLLGLALLALLVAFTVIIYHKHQRNEKNRIEKEEIENVQNELLHDAQTIDIPKPFSIQSEIVNKITSGLVQYNWRKKCDKEFPITKHEVVFDRVFFNNQYNKKDRWIIAFSYNGFGHSSNGWLSLFSFSKISGKWILNFKSVAFGFGDEWGEPPKEIRPIQLEAKALPTLMVVTGWEGSGSEIIDKNLYMLVKKKMKKVFSYESYDLNKLTNKLIETKFRIIKSKNKYFDIELKPDQSKPQTFSFNGSEYVKKKQIKK